jgi:hypothetical protein
MNTYSGLVWFKGKSRFGAQPTPKRQTVAEIRRQGLASKPRIKAFVPAEGG